MDFQGIIRSFLTRSPIGLIPGFELKNLLPIKENLPLDEVDYIPQVGKFHLPVHEQVPDGEQCPQEHEVFVTPVFELAARPRHEGLRIIVCP